MTALTDDRMDPRTDPEDTDLAEEELASRRRRWPILVVVLLLVLGSIAVLSTGFGRDPTVIDTVLMDQPAPPLSGPTLNGGTADITDYAGQVVVVNVWASWCVPCHDEAPLLTELGRDKRFQIIGINYKDSPENARRFLGRYGNPFGIVGVDGNGRASIEWGVYGVPETFLVGREGTIVYKLVGPVTPENVNSVLKVEIEKALHAGQ